MADALTPVQELAEQTGSGGLLVRRWIGCWVDMLALAAIVFVPALALGQTIDSEAGGVVLGVSAVIALLYFPVCESVWGRTLGKLITGLKVVDAQGKTPNIGRVIIRTLFRLIEVNPGLLGGIPAGICVLATKRKQRLGDMAGGTYVLDAGEVRRAVDIGALTSAAQQFA
ncbi:RDD family protein [Terricaulis sp.]|uniref:RDD family protein n=1 Tax=Terricaulis sp. TaxID=2768686 RepID=UPI0037840D38